MLLITIYLTAIVLANLIVAITQSSAPELLSVVTLVNAGAFIALDLTARDALHEQWRGRVWKRMAALVLGGSILSAATAILFNVILGLELSLNAPIASFAAFFAAGIVDTLVYQLLGDRARWVKMNGSNLVSSAADSLAFPVLAFVVLAPVMPLQVALEIARNQFIVKFACGVAWSMLITRHGRSLIEAGQSVMSDVKAGSS